MVSVAEFFLLSIVVFLAIIFLCVQITQFFYGNTRDTISDQTAKLIQKNQNVMYLLLLVSILALQKTALNCLAIFLFGLITYKQPQVLAKTVSDMYESMCFSIKERCDQELAKMDNTITLQTVGRYLWAYIISIAVDIKEVLDEFVEICKIIGGMEFDPKKIREELDKMWEDMRKLYNSETLKRDDSLDNLTDEQVLVVRERIRRNYDPREMFNKVRRLPIFLKFKEEEAEFTPLLVEHTVVFYNFFKTTIIALSLSVLYFIYTVFFFKIQFLKQLAVWFVIGMLYFWLMSGFNFFVKRYQYGKFTSQIQRFWKRTNTCFWLIEGFLLLLFFYYFLNSSQEPLYMYDYSAINQEFLVSLQVVFINIVLLSVVIYFMYFTLLRINSNSWTQLNIYLLVISVFVFFSFFLETYQFYYIISSFNERLWVFNEEENLWVIDIENPILRTKHQYLFVCLIAKYWHFLFIFLSWVFFLIKSFERRKVTYVLFGANLQNMVLLYVLNFACYIQWFKWLYRRFFDLPYTWFFTNIDSKFFVRLFFEIKLLVVSLFNFNTSFYKLNGVIYKSLNLWNVDSLAMWKFI